MSLRDEIVKLTTPAPVFCDPEDDLEDVTAAKLTENAQEKDEFTPLPASKLRQRLAAQSANTEKKYAGRKVSRTKLAVLDSDNSESDLSEESESLEEEEDSSFNEEEMIGDENSEEEEEDEDDSVGSEDIKSAEEAEEELSALGSFKAKMKSNAEPQSPEKKFSFVDDGDYSKYYDSGEESEAQSDEDEEDTDEEEENEEEEDQEEAEEEDMEEDEEEGGVSSFSKSQLNEEIKKGEAARQQLGLWDSLLEGRIKFQKILTAVNQLPQADTWQEFQEAGGDNFKEKKASVKSLLENLLNKLIQLQSLLLLQNSETQYIESGQKKPPAKKLEDPDEEEITSESESEEPKQMTQKSKEPKQAPKRRLPSEEIPGFLAKRHKDFHGYRDNTLQKWYDKTRLLGGKISAKSFSGFEQSALKQIEQILTDKDRLIKRTQMKRASYRVLGKPEESLPQVEHEAEQERERKSTTHSYDPQIFDDSDFYHQQLRELIERKTSDINDPIALSRQWLEIQRLRNKVKRKVETKASKGRKIRYHVHPKLVNFMAPKETCNWTDEARDDLFKSLFGQRGSTAAVSSDENAVGR